MTSQGMRRPEDDEDTIELELTAEEMQGLSRAAATAAKKIRFRLWPVALAVAVLGVATAVVWRPGLSQRGAIRAAPAPAAGSTPRTASMPAVPAVSAEAPAPPEPRAPPVRVKNPFDPKEIFEFPAGTTRAKAREIVSELLLQRAANRHSPGASDEPADQPPAQDN